MHVGKTVEAAAELHSTNERHGGTQSQRFVASTVADFYDDLFSGTRTKASWDGFTPGSVSRSACCRDKEGGEPQAGRTRCSCMPGRIALPRRGWCLDDAEQSLIEEGNADNYRGSWPDEPDCCRRQKPCNRVTESWVLTECLASVSPGPQTWRQTEMIWICAFGRSWNRER